jgi:nitrate reductase delta subunit
MTKTFDALARAYRYPVPGRLDELRHGIDELPEGPTRRSFAAFVDAIGALSLEAWEELHTRTLDLSPLFAPYVGYVMWGDNYQRGTFMAALRRAQIEAGVELDGELPDHVESVLRYLSATDAPISELEASLAPSLERMESALTKAEADSPYLHLLKATRLALPQGDVATGGAR